MQHILQLGHEWLDALAKVDDPGIQHWRDWLSQFSQQISSQEEAFSWLTVIQALHAVAEGNFGIGCVIVDNRQQIVAVGHNHSFKPHFRSDLHAEMVALNTLEDDVKAAGAEVNQACTLYTSSEPCPMCTARLIFARIAKVAYVVDDTFGADMVERIHHLPETIKGWAQDQDFVRATCAKTFSEASTKIVELNCQTHVDSLGSALN